MARTLCLHNGRIYGLHGLQDDTAMVIENGIIQYIGNEKGMQEYMHGEVELIDVQENIIFPGFIDTHLHLSEWARQHDFLALGDFRSLEDILEYVAENAQHKEWIFGSGWNQNKWVEKHFPHRRDLEFLGDTKAIFYSKDLHSAWVNDAVIDQFPFQDILRMLKKGYVKRDTDGRLDGLIREEAMEVLLDPLLKKQASPIFVDPYKYFKEFYRHGITSVHSMEHMNEYKKYLALYQYELNRGLRLGMYIYHSDSEKVYEQDMRFGSGGDWFRFYGIKIFVDGALGSQTAWLRKPYENAIHDGVKQLHGFKLQQAIMRAESKSCALCIHALGDAAVENVLDVLDSIDRKVRVPLRIEHAQLLDEQLIERLKERNVHVCVNPSHLVDDKKVAELHWGARSRYAFAYRSMKMAEIPFSIGSDAPVEDINPWKAIHAAVHRLGAGEFRPWYPEESISLTDAIHAYTYYGGLIAGMKEKKGVLTKGYLGDCFVCSHDVFEEGLDNWEDIHSLLTVIGGMVVHDEL